LNTCGELRSTRRAIKKHIKPTVAQFEGYKRRFLMSNDPSNAGRFTITLADVLRLLTPARGKRKRKRG